jgi:hypothetical protein
VLWSLLPSPAAAQGGAGGWLIEIYGMVQVEPGASVVTLGVKNEEIRFAVHDVRSSTRDVMARFLSDTAHRTPSLYVRGPDALLNTLIKEQPSKRALKLSGLYYPDTRVFMINRLEPFQEKPQRTF